MRAKSVSTLGDDQRWQAAAIVLESILGEDVVLDKIDSFELVDRLELRFEQLARPIQQLRDAFAESQSQ